MSVDEQGNIPPERTELEATPRLDRRGFWRGLLGEMVVAAEEMRGIGHHSLREIACLPDAALAEVVPVWRDGVHLEIRTDGVYRHRRRSATVRVHAFGRWEKMIVDQYACGRNLKTIADQVASVSGVDAEDVFKVTKELFVRLCRCGCCHPAMGHTR